MKKFICSLFVICALALNLRPADAYVNRQIAVVRIMNKAAGKAYTVQIPVGTTAEFEKLSITVRTCKQTDPFQAEDFFMFAEVSKSEDGQIFGGWMSRNEPGDNPLQNADYDLWLVECTADEKE